MSAINDLINKIGDAELRQRIEAELKRLLGQKKFGLVFEEHQPEGLDLGPIYPSLQLMDEVRRAPDKALWHALIEADNYYALQLLAYLYPGKVDCIYIDPPYNKPDSHDWKYNCDYVDGTDSYRHSKWLCRLKHRLHMHFLFFYTDRTNILFLFRRHRYHRQERQHPVRYDDIIPS